MSKTRKIRAGEKVVAVTTFTNTFGVRVIVLFVSITSYLHSFVVIYKRLTESISDSSSSILRKKMELAPLRSLDDFLLGSARFQLPNYKDLEKWGNRVANNLLYYQSNYFIMAIVLILLVTALHPLQMFYGVLSLVVVYGIFYYFVNVKSSAASFKKNHPIVGITVISGGALFLVYMLDSLLVFVFGILLPISVTFIHASLRLRNIKNKIANIERALWNKTPVGIFLESLGMQPEFIS